MTTLINAPRYDAMLKVAGTVGANIKTLRANKRALACGLILAVAVEDFKWRDAWDAAKKAAKFSTMEKDEQNGFNVMGTACRTVIDHYDTLDADQKEAIGNLTATTSTMAKAIKDAIKAKEEAEKEEAAKEAAGEDASKAQAQTPEKDKREGLREGTTNVFDELPSANVVALQTAIALLGQDTFAEDETPLIVDLLKAVDDLRARIAEAARAAA